MVNKYEDFKTDDDYQTYMSDLYERCRKFIPNLQVFDFIKIIDQPNFDIESFEISMKIKVDQEKEMNKKMLRQKYNELMEVK